MDCPAAAAESGEEFMAIVAEKSSEGECDSISDKDGRDCSPAVEEDSRRFEAEAEVEVEASNLEIRERRAVEIGTDRRLTMLIEAAELSVSDNDFPPSDFDTRTVPVEIEEDSRDSSGDRLSTGATIWRRFGDGEAEEEEE
ncbi:hypothetical protein LINPERHAP2_LOCUS14612 [Linum perenne]